MKYNNLVLPSSSYGYQTFTNPEAGHVFGTYRSFLEVLSFTIFLGGFTVNSAIFITLLTAYRTLDSFDGFLINLIFGELVASFGLAFIMFYQFASTLTPMGNGGCSFVTWLDVTSICITVTSIIAITFTLYNKLFYEDSYRLSRWKFIGSICLTWIIAGLPGLPYLATAEMGKDGYCTITDWSHGAEILFICSMIIFQIILPLSLLVYLFVRIFLALRVSPDDGDAGLTEESTPGTEANFQRAIIKQQVIFVLWIIIIFYIFLIISSFIALAIELNINNVKAVYERYTRIRELVSVFQCLKCIIIPLIYLSYYDKLKTQFRRICHCHRNQEMYKNLRYSVYQQTVHETTNEACVVSSRSSREMVVNDEAFETDRDDVAILHIDD